MTKWEYKLETFELEDFVPLEIRKTELLFTEIGEAEWELAATFTIAKKEQSWVIAIFKRPIE